MSKLHRVSYAIRGMAAQRMAELEASGEKIYKLHIGDVSAFGFKPPAWMREHLKQVLDETCCGGYTHNQGIPSIREKLRSALNAKGMGVEHIDSLFLGNGATELIQHVCSAFLTEGDRVLIPAPDYPLWTSSVRLAGAQVCHYVCKLENQWMPTVESLDAHLAEGPIRALVLINPNNPTGAVYDEATLLQLLRWAEKHKVLVLADEVYDTIYYEQAPVNVATLIQREHLDVGAISFHSLSKSFLACGYRSGWAVVCGNMTPYLEDLQYWKVLTNMRLSPNTMGQKALEISLQHADWAAANIQPDGFWTQRKRATDEALAAIEAIEHMPAKGALYVYPRIRMDYLHIENDEQFILKLLEKEKVLLVRGSGFNYPSHQHFRIAFLPDPGHLREAIGRLGSYLENPA